MKPIIDNFFDRNCNFKNMKNVENFKIFRSSSILSLFMHIR